ncbi:MULTISPECIES: hypothetical protein [Chromobacterium]|uniref:Uncharacterized protein n=1 Tax=Chromobacterium aquaticum TaxID=467180 RepID=A0ABV8ZYN8_9NEIS|nr:hypothetical protein [Chromobacterium aquaticum]MCD5362816.1 hypothetical protein [Chromobacterium aquaticum]
MNKTELEQWLVIAKNNTIKQLKLQTDWWPLSSNSKPYAAQASAWGIAFFTEAALNRAAGEVLTARCSNGSNNLSQSIVDALWVSSPDRIHDKDQLMLDYCVVNQTASSPIQVTGESEVGPSHPIDFNPIPTNGYAWDFYKLLIVPSATRLFFARVASSGGVGAPQRIEALAKSLRKLIDIYGPTFLRPNDELGAVLIPSTTSQRDGAIILWVSQGRVRFEKITPGLL